MSYYLEEYQATETPYIFSPDYTYQDKDLPNLRAAFIRHDFVLPFLKRCNPKNKSTKVYVLEGFHHPDANLPNFRMVEVYFQVYAKKDVK